VEALPATATVSLTGPQTVHTAIAHSASIASGPRISRLREQIKSGVGLLATRLEDGKGSLIAVVTDDLREKGVRADVIVRELATVVGGRGGGKPHMAQAGIPDASRLGEALAQATRVVSALVAGA